MRPVIYSDGAALADRVEEQPDAGFGVSGHFFGRADSTVLTGLTGASSQLGYDASGQVFHTLDPY
jgi:hypothetical protein